MKENENTPVEKTRKFLNSYQGKDLIKDSAMHLSALLDIEHVIIGKVTGEKNDSLETVVFYSQGGFRENRKYNLRGMPSEQVLSQGTQYYTNNVKDMFPGDEDLKNIDAQGYIGTTLFDEEKSPVGLLILIDSKPIPDPEQASQVLQEAAKQLQKKFTKPTV